MKGITHIAAAKTASHAFHSAQSLKKSTESEEGKLGELQHRQEEAMHQPSNSMAYSSNHCNSLAANIRLKVVNTELWSVPMPW